MEKSWFTVNEPDEIDSPALLIYKDRVKSNIQKMITIAGDADRLMPHVKTHKMAEIVTMQIDAGISKFKCAIIAEAEMLAEAGARTVLLAYQLNFAKAKRFISLIKKFPSIDFSSLVDNLDSAKLLNELFAKENLVAKVYIDVDAGMHRTGIEPDEKLFQLYSNLQKLQNLKCLGFHIYDGHIRDEDFSVRKQKVGEAFKPVNEIIKKITEAGFPKPKIITGGTPTFTVHALLKEEICSPGTCLLWDYGYDALLQEQDFDFAAVLMTRIISKPAEGIITIDLGHKSVAAENPIEKRIFFLDLKDYKIKSQSEEHLVIEVKDSNSFSVGDVLYGVPYHICPTVALYDEAYIIEDGKLVDEWKIEARKKKITI
jgi:D-serine deaminase-like pyridoxal phosphate-dependent protein